MLFPDFLSFGKLLCSDIVLERISAGLLIQVSIDDKEAFLLGLIEDKVTVNVV